MTLAMRCISFWLIFTTLFAGHAIRAVHACSILPLTPESIASVAIDTLRDTEVIAVGTVTSFADSNTRKNECRNLVARCYKGDNAGKDPFCDDAVEEFLDKCDFTSAANVTFTNILKGPVGGHTIVMYGAAEVCGGGPTLLAPGDSGLFCGRYDAKGGLHVDWCEPRLFDASGRVEAFERYDKQRKTLMAAVEAAPKDLEAQTRLAQFLEDWHDNQPGLDAYATIREMAPRDPTGFAGAGRMLYEMQRYAEAISFFQQALDRDRTNEGAERYLRRAQYLSGIPVDIHLLDFSGLSIANKDFDELDLRGKDFSNATLYKVSFRGANLDGANFSNAGFTKVDFTSASLRGASFRQDIGEVPTQQQLMRGRQGFESPFFPGADLTGAHFSGMSFFISDELDLQSFPRNLLQADLRGAELGCGYTYSIEDEADPGKRSRLWTNFLAGLRFVREIENSQEGVLLDDSCRAAVDYYLKLPSDCQPWATQSGHQGVCAFLKK